MSKNTLFTWLAKQTLRNADRRVRDDNGFRFCTSAFQQDPRFVYHIQYRINGEGTLRAVKRSFKAHGRHPRHLSMNDPILALFSVLSFVTHDQGYSPVYNGGDIAQKEPRYCREGAVIQQRRRAWEQVWTYSLLYGYHHRLLLLFFFQLQRVR